MGDPKTRRVVDQLDGYSPSDPIPLHEVGGDKLVVLRDEDGAWGNRAALDRNLRQVVDGYQNRLTGIGDPSRDKTYGGNWNGPDFFNQFLSGWQMQERWRGSALGGRIIETIPREMTRRGWTVSIQPEEDEQQGHADRRDARRAARRIASRSTTGRLDDLPPAGAAPEAAKAPGAVAQSPHTPGELPEVSDENTALIEALVDEQERLGLGRAFFDALCYERNYGSGGILIGVDDGEPNLTIPLDWKKVKRITHLTAFQGGWDGELIGWSWYVDPRDPKFGMPRTYQLRNLGVTVALPTPGEPASQVPVSGKPGALIFYVHESRLLMFPGQTVSHWARVQMRGAGDSIWMRINQVLSQYEQSWNGIAILLSELGMPVLKMDGFSRMMASEDEDDVGVIQSRAIAMQMSMSIAKTRIIDAKETLERVKLDLGGVADIQREFALQLAGAADMPASLLLNQGKGGLGDTGKGDQDIFDDQNAGRQKQQLLPNLRKFIALQLAASDGVANGKPPKRWTVTMNPLREMTDAARAEYRYKIAQTDQIYVDKGIATPEEVASTRFGGSDFNDGPIVLDLEGRKMMAQKEATAPEPPAPPDPTGGLPDPAAGGSSPPKALRVPGAPPAPTQDAADFVTKNGRTKVRSACSVVAAFDPDGNLIMGTDRETGKMCHPGGHAEPGEDPLSCAIRELWEETGLHPKRIALIGMKTVGGSMAQKHVSVYRALVEGEPTNANDPDKEFTAFRRVPVPNGRYPDDVKANLKHERDVVGPMLRRRQ